MSENKQTVRRYFEAFGRSDHPAVLACLHDDIEWIIPGLAHHVGKAAFDREINNKSYVGRPSITLLRLTEENDVVIAEGGVQCARKDGGLLNAAFCNVFVLRDARVRQLTSYLMEVAR